MRDCSSRLERITHVYPKVIWLNPTPERYWPYTASTDLIHRLFAERMYPLTLEGLDKAMRELTR